MNQMQQAIAAAKAHGAQRLRVTLPNSLKERPAGNHTCYVRDFRMDGSDCTIELGAVIDGQVLDVEEQELP